MIYRGLDPRLDNLFEAIEPAEQADMNGYFTQYHDFGNSDLIVGGNGILDGANELGLLQRILSDPTFDNGVLNHAEVMAAYQANRDAFVQEARFSTIRYFHESLDLLPAYLTLGGGAAEAPVIDGGTVIDRSTGSFGNVALIVAEANREGDNITCCLDANDYISFPELLPEGDADGDGASNLCEYNTYGPADCSLSKATTSYVDAALDPGITPATCAETPGEGEGEGEEGPADCSPANVAEPSFETGAVWTATNGALVSSTLGSARTGDGAGYLLFNESNGVDTLSQDIVIPANDLATLTFHRQTLRRYIDLAVLIDGNEVYTESDLVSPAYEAVSVDISAYADGASHTLAFSAQAAGAKAVITIDGVNIDDVAIESCVDPCIACVPSQTTIFQIGDSACLRVPDPVAAGSSYQWSREGQPLSGIRYEGVNCRHLQIFALTLEDSGTYACEYDDGGKAPATYLVTIEVAPPVPAVSWPALCILFIAAAAVAGLAWNRRGPAL